MTQDDTHRKLLQLVHAYVSENLLLEIKPTLERTITVRKLLSDIRRAASDRRKEVMDTQKQRREYLDQLKGKSNLEEADDQDD